MEPEELEKWVDATKPYTNAVTALREAVPRLEAAATQDLMIRDLISGNDLFRYGPSAMEATGHGCCRPQAPQAFAAIGCRCLGPRPTG